MTFSVCETGNVILPVLDTWYFFTAVVVIYKRFRMNRSNFDFLLLFLCSGWRPEINLTKLQI